MQPTISGWFGNGAWAMIRIIMKDKVNRVIHDNVVHDSFYDLMVNKWQDNIDELNLDRTYAEADTHPELVHLMNSARGRATMALREARIERNRRRRMKGLDREDDEMVIGGASSDASTLSDPGSDLESEMDEDGETDDGQTVSQSSEKD
jgi:hypothetical protein